MRILVTGSGGFIGRHVKEALTSEGHEPLDMEISKGLDVTDPSAFRLFKSRDEDVDGVIHLAGVLGTAELFQDATHAIDTNIKGTLNVLQFCRSGWSEPRRFVGITMPDVWNNVYQATKKASGILASAWHESFDVPVSHVRAFNAYGPGQAHGPGHPQKIIPTFATLAWQGRPIPIWGDGLQTVDLVHVKDLAALLVEGLNHSDDITIDGGTGTPETVLQVAEWVLEVTGSKAGVEHHPMRAGETPGTDLKAAGDGWDLIPEDLIPKPDWKLLEEAILSYKP